MRQRRLALFSFFALIILLVNLAYPAIALADETTPPPGTPPAAAGTSSSATGAAPSSAAPTDAPPQPTDSSASQSASPTDTSAPGSASSSAGTASSSGTVSSATTAAPTDTGVPTDTNIPTGTATPGDGSTPTEAATVEAVLSAVPTGTPVVVLDSQGQPVALATVEAGQIITNGDPMWCPAGVLPGGAGCTTSFNTFTGAGGLLTALAGGGYSGNGVIYVAQNYTASAETGNITIDGSILTTLQALTIQGGWDFGLNALSSTPSIFSGVALDITNWNSAVAVNNVEIENTSTDGLSVSTTGNISLSDVSSHDNTGNGASLDNSAGTGSITLSGSSFSGNGSDGVDATSKGNITVGDTNANSNGGNGASLDNLAGSGNITLTSPTNFNYNGGDGLDASTTGNIKISDTAANGNGGLGASLENCGCQSGNTTLDGGTFTNNGDIGLAVDTLGKVALNNITSIGNAGEGVQVLGLGNVSLNNSLIDANKSTGVEIDITSGAGNVSLNNVWSSNNTDGGLFVGTGGTVSLNQFVGFDNTTFGAEIASGNGIQVANSFFSGGCFLGEGQDCGTQMDGAALISAGAVSIQNSQFNNNTDTGLLVLEVSQKSITLTNVQADGNTNAGAVLLGDSGDIVPITVCGGSFSNTSAGPGLIAATLGPFNLSTSTQFVGNSDPNTFIASHFNLSAKCGAQSGKKGDYETIKVTDGQHADGGCSGLVGVVLELPDGDTLTVPCQTGGPAALSHLSIAQLPAALPDGFNLIAALHADAARDGLTISFTMPVANAHYTILFWNGSSWKDLGGSTTVDGLFGVTWVSRGIYVLATK